MTGLLLLAAGSSQRLGSPKQLLTYKGKTLLNHCIDTALASTAQPILVVLGANFDEIYLTIPRVGIQVLNNTGWEEGMSSSVRLGIAELEKDPGIDSALIMLCDQPYVTSGLLEKLITAKDTTGKKIITCFFNDTYGPPACFHRSLFNELSELKGQNGAKSLIINHPREVVTINFPEGATDIDTKEDYFSLK